MANKTYWSILKKDTFYVYGDPGGWEIAVRNGVCCFTLGTPKAVKTSANIKLAMIKRIAQAVNTKSEYDKLKGRINKEDHQYILQNDLKGVGLVSWAFNTHTSDEYYRLLRYN